MKPNRSLFVLFILSISLISCKKDKQVKLETDIKPVSSIVASHNGEESSISTILYNDSRNISSVKTIKPVYGGTGTLTNYEYSSNNKLVTRTYHDELNRTSTDNYTYNSTGQLIKVETALLSYNNLDTHPTPYNTIIDILTFSYDTQGRIIKAENVHLLDADRYRKDITDYSYDNNGLLKTIKNYDLSDPNNPYEIIDITSYTDELNFDYNLISFIIPYFYRSNKFNAVLFSQIKRLPKSITVYYDNNRRIIDQTIDLTYTTKEKTIVSVNEVTNHKLTSSSTDIDNYLFRY